MYTFALVLSLILVGFVLGFASYHLAGYSSAKKERVEFDLLNRQNDNLRYTIQTYFDLISGLYGKNADNLDIIEQQNSRINELLQQIKDMQIVRTKPLDETVNILNDNFFRNALFFAENNHDVFMECIRTIILETFIKEIIVLGEFTYRVKMENEEYYLIKTPEKLVYFVKNSYDLKKSLNAIRKN